MVSSYICVFCGASPGYDETYAHAARETGAAIVENGYGLVYGGGNAGLMGIVAQTVLAAGGEAVGVIPEALMDREIAHRGLSRLEVVGSMHARKMRMNELCDHFVALPGGFGTLEELTEVLSWAQIGLHTKVIGIVNVRDYYTPLLRFFDTMVEEGFLLAASRDLLLSDDEPHRLVSRIDQSEPRSVDRWTVVSER